MSASPESSNGRFACLMYHAVDGGGSTYTVTPDRLRDQCRTLREGGFTVESFRQLLGRSPAAPLPRRYVVMSFDDGEVNAEISAAIIGEFGWEATFFVTRDRARSDRRFLDEAGLRRLYSSGMDLGTHGTTHRPLIGMPIDSAITEMRESKVWLEDLIGAPVRSMSFPGGLFNRRLVSAGTELGYDLMGTSEERSNSPTAVLRDRKISRIAIRREFSPEDFQRIISCNSLFIARRRLRLLALWLPKQLVYGRAGR